jgi:hypothetical protein
VNGVSGSTTVALVAIGLPSSPETSFTVTVGGVFSTAMIRAVYWSKCAPAPFGFSPAEVEWSSQTGEKNPSEYEARR